MNPSLKEIYDGLCRPFPTAWISWRVGPTNDRWRKEGEPLRGQPLCYIDARVVQDRLDAVVGFSAWQRSYTPGVGNSITCNIGIRCPVFGADGTTLVGFEWVWKGDGAGPSDTEPEKGTYSDAFKRAAVNWGIGRYLYDLKAPWMHLEQRGKTAVIPDAAQEDLRKL